MRWSSVLAVTSGESIVLVKVPLNTRYVSAVCNVCLVTDMIPDQGDGPHWTAFSGEIYISSDVKVGGFKACGFSIKVRCLLSVYSPS